MVTVEKLEWMDEAKPELRMGAAELAFEYFFAYYLTHYLKSPFAPFHYDMARDLHDLTAGQIKELGWFMFREGAKTSFAKAFVLWCILYRKFEYINVDSHDKANAERFLFDVVLELQTNRKIRADFGEIFNAKRSPDEKTQKRVSDFLTTNGVRVEAHSTQEPVRGRLHGSIRPQLVIADDFEDLTTIRSEAATRQVKDHFAEFKGGLDQAKGRVLYLGNYLSESGNVQAIMDKALVDPSMRVRSIWIKNQDGLPSWPERHVLTDLEAQATGKISIEEIKRRMWTPERGDGDFMREMMGKPFDPSTAKFRLGMFKSISREEVDRMETANYLLIDPPGQAYTKESAARGEGDYVGYALVKVTHAGKWMVECWRARSTPKELMDNIFSLWTTQDLIAVGIENTQFWQGLKTTVEDEELKRGTRLNIIELAHTALKSKKDRVLALLPKYESGMVWHIVKTDADGRDTNTCADLEGELKRFPINDHDDACLSGDTLISTPKGKVRIDEVRAGDEVLTPIGIRKVLCSGKTGTKMVMERFGLTATPDHRAFDGQAFSELSSSMAVMRFGLREQMSWAILKSCLSTERPTASWGKDGISSLGATRTQEGGSLQVFMSRFGRSIASRKFKKAFMSIISMAIATTIAMKTWASYSVACTLQNIRGNGRRPTPRRCLNTSATSEEKLQSGIDRALGENGTRNTEENHSKNERLSKSPASSAASLTRPFSPRDRSSATTLPADKGGLGKIDVFNLTVEDAHCFYANDRLVANCDSLAMALEIAQRPEERRPQHHSTPSSATAYVYGAARMAKAGAKT